MQRRDLVKAILAATATSTVRPNPSVAEVLYKCVPPKPKEGFYSSLKDVPIIDVHCHIFNATDIPAYQYAEGVVGLTAAFDEVRDEKSSIYQLEKWEIDAVYERRDDWWEEVLDLVKNFGGFITNSRPLDRIAFDPGSPPRDSAAQKSHEAHANRS